MTVDHRDPRLAAILAKARAVAHQIGRHAPFGAAQIDDLIGAAHVGVARALSRHRGDLDATFEAFAIKHARGAVFDEMRKLDPLSRRDRRRARQVARVQAALQQRLGRNPDEMEMARAMEMDLTSYRRLREQMDYRLSNEVELVRVDRSAEDELEEREQERLMRSAVNEALQKLPPREAETITATFTREKLTAEIGQSLGISEGRVSQLRKAGLLRLREMCCANDTFLAGEVG
jgi:RNA polymerase sigma factor for flagellar operon FliA